MMSLSESNISKVIMSQSFIKLFILSGIRLFWIIQQKVKRKCNLQWSAAYGWCSSLMNISPCTHAGWELQKLLRSHPQPESWPQEADFTAPLHGCWWPSPQPSQSCKCAGWSGLLTLWTIVKVYTDICSCFKKAAVTKDCLREPGKDVEYIYFQYKTQWKCFWNVHCVFYLFF